MKFPQSQVEQGTAWTKATAEETPLGESLESSSTVGKRSRDCSKMEKKNERLAGGSVECTSRGSRWVAREGAGMLIGKLI